MKNYLKQKFDDVKKWLKESQDSILNIKWIDLVVFFLQNWVILFLSIWLVLQLIYMTNGDPYDSFWNVFYFLNRSILDFGLIVFVKQNVYNKFSKLASWFFVIFSGFLLSYDLYLSVDIKNLHDIIVTDNYKNLLLVVLPYTTFLLNNKMLRTSYRKHHKKLNKN